MDKEAEAIETIASIDTAVDGPSFGGYLNTLLTERNLTPRDLASLLELDLSLVYKWLRGERTPRFNSGHADSIAEAVNCFSAIAVRVESTVSRSMSMAIFQ